MAIGWLAVLQSVPWSEVISNAPKVAEGAKKLWSVVAKKAPQPEVSESNMPPSTSSSSQTIASLEVRIVELETAVTDLNGQMLASSELIKALADQNTQLIQRIETNRVRMLWLSGVTLVVAVAALLGLILVFTWHGV